MDRKPNKIVKLEKFVIRDRPIKKVGLDTNICLCWMESKKYAEYQPNISKKENSLFINYKVFGELMGLLIHDSQHPLSEEQARSKIFSFLKSHNINIIKKKEIDLNKVEEVYNELKSIKFKNNPEDTDLKVIAIFYVGLVDCIFSHNENHFKEACEYLKIAFENPFMIKTNSMKEINFMLRNAFGSRKKKGKY